MKFPKFLCIVFLCAAATNLLAQRDRITRPIDRSQRIALGGHLHPKALPEDDQGAVAPSFTLGRLTLVLKPSDSQQAELDQLLQQQQDPTSPQYHRWLTPEEYAARFGASQDDLNKITTWLQSQNLMVLETGRGRNWVAFTGTAAQVESAFGVHLHHFLVNGERHFANTNEPTVPAGFAGVIAGIHGLHDFRLRAPRHTPRSVAPDYTSGKGAHYLAPDDAAVIYNMKALYDSGTDAAGQNLAVVGQTAIDVTDLQSFRNRFGLPGNDPQVVLVPSSTDPGIVKGDVVEADLDLEWTAAVARNANITYVYAQDVMDAAQYVIDQNVAPVMSMSYGLCEAQTPASDANTLQAWAKQGNAQGMTWFAASGDSGATDCWDGTSKTPATVGVDLPAGIPEVTGVGGATFNEGTDNYWNLANDGSGASVLSYIPEMAWNDSTTGSPAATGGGASSFFPKPAWQTGPGVPNDGARDVPDIAFSASADHDGYLIVSGGQLQVVGGTSVAAPVFAGIAALLNRALAAGGGAAGLGNINPKLYSLAQTTPGVFHDITVGNNVINVICGVRSRNCTPGSVGFNAGPGYDQVTGLGSLDAYKFIAALTSVGSSVQRGTATLALSAGSTALAAGDGTTLTATVTAANGGTPQGSVTFMLGGTVLGTATLAGSRASLSVDASRLSAGVNTITAQYSGDSAYNAASASITINVAAGGGAPSIAGVANGASFGESFAPGMILSVFGSQLAPSVAAAVNVPLPGQLAGVSATINGITAPLYYVSPGQLNIQVPYETAVNAPAVLRVNNNGQTATATFNVVAAAPGIFTDGNRAPVPNTSAARGDVVTLYVTGAGAVSPGIGTGAAPAAGTPVNNLPAPAQGITVSVGGVNAPVTFVGIPPGLVGVVQVNYQVPAGAGVGNQAVVAVVGGISSAPAILGVR